MIPLKTNYFCKLLWLRHVASYKLAGYKFQGCSESPFVILNTVKDLLRVAIGGRFFAALRMTTTGKSTF